MISLKFNRLIVRILLKTETPTSLYLLKENDTLFIKKHYSTLMLCL